MILAKDLWGAMDYKFLQIEIADNVATVTINRPEVLNGLHPEAHSEMERVWEDLGSNDRNRACRNIPQSALIVSRDFNTSFFRRYT